MRVRVRVRVRARPSRAQLRAWDEGGILPKTSRSIVYSRVVPIATFSHCQPKDFIIRVRVRVRLRIRLVLGLGSGLRMG